MRSYPRSGRESDADSLTVLRPPSRRSIRKEVNAVATILKEERHKGIMTIGIVREESVSKLKKACKYQRRWFEMSSPAMRFTTAEDLQDTIDQINLSKRYLALKLLASPEIPELCFHVPGTFPELMVLRCVTHHDGGLLLIDGSSTYNDVRADSWQAYRHEEHKFIIGAEQGVNIRPGLETGRWARYRENPTPQDKAAARRLFEKLSRRSGWDEAKGALAALLGIAVGGAKLSGSFTATAGGGFFKWAFAGHTVQFGAAGAKMSVIGTAAGSALILGTATAAAVYFIPWGSLWEWLQRAFASIWDKVCSIWEQFKAWVYSLFGGSSSEQSETDYRGFPRPMTF